MDPRGRQRPADVAPRGRGWTLAVVIVLLLGLSPAVAAGQNPLGPLPSQPATTPTVSAPTTTTTSGAGPGLSTPAQIGLFAAGILLIGGIAFLIRRDARSAAPVTRPPSDGPRATVKPQAKRVEQSRARAKAARRQRKRARQR